MSPRPDQPRRVLAEGRFTRLVAQDGWEWVQRVNTSGAVVIAAVTSDRRLLLVEQYRIPLQRRVIELPAGLAGDTDQTREEELAAAAARELREETGFEADSIRCMVEGPSSAGITDEVYAIFLAQNCRQVGPGGGEAAEDIQVHAVPLNQVAAWLEARRAAGTAVDPRVYAGLYFVHAAALCEDSAAERAEGKIRE